MDQKGRRKRRPSDRGADRRLEAIADIIEPLALSLGAHCQIVLQDYRISDRSVVALAGEATERRVGSAISEIGLSVFAEGTAPQDLNYLANASNGRVMNSSTILLRDANRRVFGASRILGAWRSSVVSWLMQSALIGQDVKPEPTTFANDIHDVIDASLRDGLHGRSVTTLSRNNRLQIVRALDARGVFLVKRAVAQVAPALGVSRATAHAWLQTIREEALGAASGVRRGGACAADRRR